MNRLFYISIFVIILSSAGGVYAEDKTVNNTGREPSSLSKLAPLSGLTLEKAIDIVLSNNLTLRSAKYDVIMSDTEYRYYQKKYSPFIGIESGYSRQKLPPSSGFAALSGDKSYQCETSAMLSKAFSTGTTVSAGATEKYFDSNDPALPIFGKMSGDPAYHNPSFFVSLQQELLKNSFGYSERIQNKVLNNAADMRRRAIINQLSYLVVGALIDYWDVTVQKSAVENARMELESNQNVRKIIAVSTQYGLMDVYGLHQFNAIVAASETKLEIAQQNRTESERKLLRTLNLPPETQVTGVTDLKDQLPELNIDDSMKAAFAKRADYKNVNLEIENSLMALKMYENDALPSLTFNMNLSTQGQREKFSPAARDAASGEYPSWQVMLKATYPLDDTEQKVNIRNAYFQLKQVELKKDDLRKDIHDEVLNRLERVRLAYSVLTKARTGKNESEKYYARVYDRFRKEKATSLDIKTALDTVSMARQQELEALIGFNIALLQFDLSKNEIFECFNVNVEKYINLK